NLFDGTGESYYLKIAAGGIPGGVALTANRILAIEVNNAARTITFSGDPTLGDWFDQSVKAAADAALNSLNIADWLITGGTIVASGSITTLASLITGGDIGNAADPDLLQCGVGALTVNGTLTLTGAITSLSSPFTISAAAAYILLHDSGTNVGHYIMSSDTTESSGYGEFSIWRCEGGSRGLYAWGQSAYIVG
ncbi:unnamed protein product, partial [marine sediment metagenome]